MQAITICIYVVLSVSGVVLFKMGSTESLYVLCSKDFFSIQISWISVLGLLCYIASFLIYMGLIAKNDLSYLIPVISGAVYLLTLLSAITIFKENVHTYQVIGSALILAGIFLMNLKKT